MTDLTDVIDYSYYNMADFEGLTYEQCVHRMRIDGIEPPFNEEEFNSMSLSDLAVRHMKPYFPNQVLDYTVEEVQPLADQVTQNGHGEFSFHGETIPVDSSVSQLVFWAHSISCLKVYNRREDDPRNQLGGRTPDYVEDPDVAEMKTGVTISTVKMGWNEAYSKYSADCEEFGFGLSFQGITGRHFLYTHNTPDWMLNNLRMWAPALCALIAWTRGMSRDNPHIREIRTKAFDDIEHSRQVYPLDVPCPELLVTEDDVNREFEEVLTPPKSFHEAIKVPFTQPPMSKKAYRLRVEANKTHTEGKLTVMPLYNMVEQPDDLSARDFDGPTGFFDSPQGLIFSQCFGKLHRVSERHIPADFRPTVVELSSVNVDTASELSTLRNKVRSNEGATDISIDVKVNAWLASRGRALDAESKQPRSEKSFSLKSNFLPIHEFLDMDQDELAPVQRLSNSEKTFQSDNSSGSVDYFMKVQKTKVYDLFRNVSEVAEAIGGSVQHYHENGRFELQQLPSGAYLVLNSKGPACNVFFFVCIPASASVPFDDEWIQDGGYLFSKGHCVTPSRIDNYSYLHLKYTIQRLMWEELGCKTGSHCMMSMLLKLDAKEQTQNLLQLSRYAGMQLLAGNACSPTTVLSKFDENPRSLVCAFYIDSLLKTWEEMEKLPPEIGTKLRGGVNYSVSRYISWVDNQELDNIELILNTFYFHSSTPPVDTDNFQSSAVIMEKLLKAELSYRKHRRAVLWDYDFEKDYSRSHTFDPEMIQFCCSAYIRMLRKRFGPHFMDRIHEKIKMDLGSVTFEELATVKRSVVENPSVYHSDADLRKATVVENLFTYLKEFSGIDRPFQNLDAVIQKVVQMGNIISVFKKKQKGVREILILTFSMRILQRYIESVSRAILSFSETEMMANPHLKESFLLRHEDRARSCPDATSTVWSSADATTWCQGFTPRIFFEFLRPFVPDSIKRDLANILNLMTSKRLRAPNQLAKKKKNFDELGDEWVGSDSLRALFESMDDTTLFQGLNLLNCTNMGQGILHFSSSLGHDIFLTGIQEIFQRKGDVVMSFQVSSDDSGVVLSGPAAKVAWLARALCSLYPLMSAKISREKSTIAATKKIYEFNSVWWVQNSQIAVIIKSVGPSLTVSNGSFIKRLDAFSTIRSQCVSFGAGSALTSLIQICQQIVHYKLLGSDSFTDGNALVEEVQKTKLDSLGYFTPDPECLCGLFSSDLSRKISRRESRYRRMLERAAEKDPLYQRGQEGELDLMVHFSQNSTKDWLSFKRFVKNFELWAFPSAEEMVRRHPGLILTPTHSRKQTILKILVKIKGSLLRETFATKDLYYLQGAAVYLGRTKCLTAFVVKDGKEYLYKWNLLGLIRDLTSKMTEEELALQALNPDESYAMHLISSAPNSTITRTAKAPISYRRRAQIEKLKHDTHHSLTSSCADIYTGNVTSRTYPSFVYYREKFPWLMNTFPETMEVLMKDSLSTVGHIVSIRDKMSSICTLGPVTNRTNLPSDIMDDYFKFPSRTTLRTVSNADVVGSLTKKSIIGCLMRCAAYSPDLNKFLPDFLNRLYSARVGLKDYSLYQHLKGVFSERHSDRLLFFMSGLLGVHSIAMRDVKLTGFISPGRWTGDAWTSSTMLVLFRGIKYFVSESNGTLSRIRVDKDDYERALKDFDPLIRMLVESKIHKTRGKLFLESDTLYLNEKLFDFRCEHVITKKTSALVAVIYYNGKKFGSFNLSGRSYSDTIPGKFSVQKPLERVFLGTNHDLSTQMMDKLAQFLRDSTSFVQTLQSTQSDLEVIDYNDEDASFFASSAMEMEKFAVFVKEEAASDGEASDTDDSEADTPSVLISDIAFFLQPRNKTPVLLSSILGPLKNVIKQTYFSMLMALKDGGTTDSRISMSLGIRLMGEEDDFSSGSYEVESEDEEQPQQVPASTGSSSSRYPFN